MICRIKRGETNEEKSMERLTRRQRWVAKWNVMGLQYVLRFTSLSSRVIAELDLKLLLMDLGYSPPAEFILEEDNWEGALRWNYPVIQRP